MDIPLQIYGALSLLGIATGFLAGLLGVGGGMLMVPFLTAMITYLGVPADVAVKMGIATSMATIIFTSMSSVRAHHKRGAVRWEIVRHLSPGIILGGALASAGVFALVKGTAIAICFGLFVFASATQMLRKSTPKPTRQMPGPAGQFTAGAVIGFFSGLVGAGGGFLSVPFMTRSNVPLHNAVATSAALGFPIALVNAIGYVISGYTASGRPGGAFGFLWLPGLLTISIFSVLMAPVGARMAHSLPVATLKKAFAAILYYAAVYMLWKGLHG